jgi:hypothetical protein
LTPGATTERYSQSYDNQSKSTAKRRGLGFHIHYSIARRERNVGILMRTVNEEHKITGEVINLEVDTFHGIIEAWKIATEYERVAKALKAQLKALVPDYIGDNGRSEEWNGYQFRVSNIQKMTYDKPALRAALGEDTYDLFMEPRKSDIDEYLAELVARGDPDGVSTKVRAAMVPKGKPYQQMVLEKVTRDD